MDKTADIGFAKLDISRSERTGFSETVYCPGKNCEQLRDIFITFMEHNVPVMGSRCSAEQSTFIKQHDIPVNYDPASRILTSLWAKPQPLDGTVAVCTGGTADIPVAEEAAGTAEFMGCQVERFYDVGVAGLHRLPEKADAIRKCDVVIAAAGMEGALGSVLAGLVSAPLIAIPTSVGYGAGFNGIAPLLAMLNSCAEGMAVVNIDNGFGAAVMACRIIRMMNKKENGK